MKDGPGDTPPGRDAMTARLPGSKPVEPPRSETAADNVPTRPLGREIDLQPGDVLVERFEIEAWAGSGGMGVVYRARDRLNDNTVALKISHTDRAWNTEWFAREAQALADLHHPAIVRYIAHGATARGAQYLAMEWLDGIDLSQRLLAGTMTVSESVALVERVAEALAVTHRRGIVHRDIKPGNVFLLGGRVEHIKLLDFGTAWFGDLPAVGAEAPEVIGTPGYMAPEQARGSNQLDARVDVFGLGCVLFRCIAGRPPFTGQDVRAVLAKILFEEAPRLSELRPDVPHGVEALVSRMLSKLPESRPRDGDEVVAEISALAAVDRRSLRPVRDSLTSITAGEQRLLCVVLAGGARLRANSEETPVLLGPQTDRSTIDALQRAVAEYAARLEPLLDGSVVVTLSGRGAATDQAARAARCALAMRSVVADAPMALAIGRADFSTRLPVGDVIDRAAQMLRDAGSDRSETRLESDLPVAPATRSVRIDEATAGLLDSRFELRGDATGLELVSEREIADATRTLLGRATPCVGRERELAFLQALYTETAAEPVARTALLTGAAGVGKSRVRYEFLQRLRARGEPMEVWIARGDPMSSGSPFGMIAPMLRREAGVLDGEPLAVRQQKLRARVARQVPAKDVARVTEFLGELAGVVFSDAANVQLRAARHDAMLMGDQMRRAWEDFVTAECAAQPVLIVLEDLHWGDLPSVSFVDGALRNLRDRPLMVLALGRPDVHQRFPGLWSERGVQEVRLGELTRKASIQLVRAVLGERTDEATIASLVERAAGNAFYLEELVRAVAEGRGNALPETVLAMVQARLEGLEAEARRILRAASVFGQVFWQGGVAALLGGERPSSPLSDWLSELVKREVIARRGAGRFPGERAYVFRHALVREAAYAMLTEDDRTLGHKLAGDWLEAAGESDAMVLAEHFERGGDRSRAAGWYASASEEALEGNDFAAALDRAERGLACGASGEALGRLRLLQAEAHKWRGEHADADKRGREAMQSLARGSAAWCRAAGEVAVASGRVGDRAQQEALAAELSSLEWGANVSASQIIASARAVALLLLSGGYGQGEELLEQLETVADDPVARDPSVAAWIHRVRATWALCTGDAGAYLKLIEASAESFEQAGDLRGAGLPRVNAGFASLEVGANDRAERLLRDTLAAAEHMGLVAVAASARQNLGLALARVGALDEARRVESQAVQAFVLQGDRRMEGIARIYLASILAQAGVLDAAAREALQAVYVLRDVPPTRAHALAMLARVRLKERRGDDALQSAAAAMAVLDELGSIGEGEALVRLVHAEALDATGDRSGARGAIIAARDRVHARADKISDAELRRGFLECVPDNSRTLEIARSWCEDDPGIVVREP